MCKNYRDIITSTKKYKVLLVYDKTNVELSDMNVLEKSISLKIRLFQLIVNKNKIE